ncbi:MAG: EAL domain-containing protein [Actinobacteria bacterium]|nr:EAL domain-containing protein [Actinomycetota bacterium]
MSSTTTSIPRVWRDATGRSRLHGWLAVRVAIVTAVAYATGWGPLVGAFGHLLTLADGLRRGGARTIRPALAWSLVATTAAQLGIVLGIVPNYVPDASTHGVALVASGALVVVAEQIRIMMRTKELAEAELRASEERFRGLVQYSSDAIVVIGGDARVKYMSPSATGVLGYSEEDMLGQEYLQLLHPEDLPRVLAFVEQMAGEAGAVGMIENRIRHKDGRWLPVESNCHNLLFDRNIRGFVLNTRDVSDRKVLEERLEYRAFHDTLTGLPNRALFRDRVAHTVARASRSKNPFSVMFLDLDGFKVVNDTLGHAAGDELLVEVAKVIQATIRESDTPARLGGDEFAILLEEVRDDASAARVATRLLEALRRPITLQGKEVRIDASIGIAFSPEAADAEELLRNADIAMYMAKHTGKGDYEIFEPQMHVSVVQRLELEADLQHAVEDDQFELFYQPIVVLETAKVVGVEALIRWHHPERGMVPPGEFIPVAEESGLIIPLSRWVFEQATSQLKAWQEAFPSHPPLYISVNVSARHVAAGCLVEDVSAALDAAGLPAESLTLEITEGALLQDTQATMEVFTQLRQLGVRIAIDDFGTGYSSLSYLQNFPIDVLKIDRSFIDGMSKGTQSPALVRAIIELGRSLHLETVAEGIEHNEQLSRFRELRCQLGQGYLFARPADQATIGALLAKTADPVGAASKVDAS